MELEDQSLSISILLKSEFKLYEKQLIKLFEENYFKNGGMLYSDDFIINSDFILIVQVDNKIVAYMAVCNLKEKDLDRRYETYQEDPILENSMLIKHLVVSEEYRKQRIATKLFEYIKLYAVKNKIRYIYLWTTLNNTIAINLYEKQGFCKMGDFYPADGTFQGLNRISFYYDGS